MAARSGIEPIVRFLEACAAAIASESAKTADAQLRNAFANFRANNVRDITIDLRYNGGGDIGTAQRFIQWFRSQERLQTPDSLIVLIGRHTFSAAVVTNRRSI